LVGDTGFEPVTSSVSRKRATAAPIARGVLLWCCTEVETGFEPVYAALQAAASPLGHSTVEGKWIFASERTTGLEPATSTLARLRSTN
jgi:hypothetical protein